MRNAIRSGVSGFLLAAGLCLAAATASAQGWSDGSPMTTARAFAGAALLGDDLYVVGGDSTSGPRSVAEIYDVRGNIWRPAVALPVGLQHFGMAELNGRLFIAGGHEAPPPRRADDFGALGATASGAVSDGGDTDNVWIFDPRVGAWLSGPSMPAARAGHGLVAVDGQLYAIGGRGEGASRVFVYDPGRDRWSVSGSPMPSPRVASAYVAGGGLIYAIGGLDSAGAASSRVDIFDPSNGSWRTGPSLPEPRAGHVAAVLDGRLHVTGGEQRRPLRTYGDHFVLDLATGVWRRAPSMPTPRHGAVATATADRFIVVGGSPGAGVYTVFTESDVVDIYSE
ncbi:MAG: kelch repeat-containing protein [Parvibaculum sp.]|nr:kelch repeat-containing protein [Parvibaculum sp.]